MHLLKTLCVMALVFATGLLGTAIPADALEIKLEPPGEREFLRDLAGMLDQAAEARVREVADRLLSDKATPIIVVTIDSMANHGGEGMSIESFSTILFNQWQIGHEKLGDQDWNTGILLLVSKGDRKARIELGGGWGRSEDASARRIMSERIVPHFRDGRFSDGIVAGVEGLDAMVRKLEMPRAPRRRSRPLTNAALLGLAIFTGVSVYRRGSNGWAWGFWRLVFSLIGVILIGVLQSSGSRRGSGRRFGGGSFGRGTSGGGGATGEW